MTAHHTAAAVWQATLGQLEVHITPANFETWLRDTIGLRHDDERFVVGAPNAFATEWLSLRLRPAISKALAHVLGRPVDLGFEVIPGDDAPPPVLPLGGAPSAAERRAAVVRPALNPALTFDTFVIGEENRLAFDAARAAARGCAANPLAIFGGPGLGKTHLLTAIGHAAADAGRSVVFITAERFMNDCGRAAAEKNYEPLRARYRSCDVLIVDDVQCLERSAKFQEDFLHAFNDLQARGATIVVSCDRAPSRLAGLGDALRSRLQWGLAADVQKPGFDTRLAILRAKARQHASALPDDALSAIASKCCPTVRELEGFLHRVIAFVPLVGGALTRDLIEQALDPLAHAVAAGDDAPPAPEAVLAAVCKHTGAVTADLHGHSRGRGVTYARHLAMFLLKDESRRSVAQIGRALGNRNHATVLAGIKRIGLEERTRPETAADLRAIRALLHPEPPAATAALAG